MANSKIKVLLKKIESIIGEEESISNLELDLVKSYLRDVYVLTDNLAPMSQAPASKRQSEVKSSPVSNHSVTEHIIPPQDPVKIRAIPPQEIEHVANKSQPADGLSEYSQKLPNGREDVLGAERTN
ncbi:MAG: hypothetical protein HKN76_21160, partial [Saprospiraceae bacterium]|nr:hypothetical protein [Saprospiraceae bacterium]